MLNETLFIPHGVTIHCTSERGNHTSVYYEVKGYTGNFIFAYGINEEEMIVKVTFSSNTPQEVRVTIVTILENNFTDFLITT